MGELYLNTDLQPDDLTGSDENQSPLLKLTTLWEKEIFPSLNGGFVSMHM